MNINKVILAGNLTRDVELKYTQGGLAIAKFGIANNERWQAKDGGEKKETTHFVDCVAFGKTAEVIDRFFGRGKAICVEGKLNFSSWEDNDGKKRSKLEVKVETFHFVGPKDGDGGSGNGGDRGGRSDGDYGDIPF